MANCKTLFFAFDSADAELVMRWMDDGTLPNLAALCRRGLHGRLQTSRGFGSDAIWPSVFTGVDPSRHGRYHHKQDQTGTYDVADRRRVDILRKPVWEIVSDAGGRVAVLDLPKAPAAAGLNGIQVLDWHGHYGYPEEFRTQPATLKSSLIEQFGGHRTCPCLAVRYQDYDPSLENDAIEALRRSIDESLAMALKQLDAGPWDLFMVAFGASHCVGHQFWHLHDNTHPRARIASFAGDDPVREIYSAIDSALGRLLERLDDQVGVLVFAGAGMGPNYVRRELLDELLLRLDSAAPSQMRRAVKVLKAVWQQLPKRWRKRLSGPAHLAENRLTARDRSGRRCFATQANDSVGGIRINLQGREPNGQVTWEEFDAVCDQLIAALQDIRIDNTGEPLVQDILRTDRLYRGQYLDQLPDILIEWNHCAPIGSVTSPLIGTLAQPRLPDWSGTHRAGAFAAIAGPTVGTPGAALPGDATILDLAPTLAAMSGVVMRDTQGKVLI